MNIHLWEAFKLSEITKKTEQLHWDTGRDDEQAHGEYD